MLQNIKLFFVSNWAKLLTLLLIIVLGINRISPEKPYAAGDAVEYTLMTEAFFKHYTPEIKASDYESFKDKFIKTSGWESNNKGVDYELVKPFITSSNTKLLDNQYSFFVDKKGRKYSCHFWFYSLINVPARVLCAIHPFNPFLTFEITNLLLIIFSCFIFLKTSKFNGLYTAAFCLLFFYSTNYWYIFWEHPEVFSFCFVSVGVWLFFHDKYYWGILFASLAALQNQPIVMLVAILCIIALIKKGFNVRNLLYLFLSSIIIFLPSLFYYYHFGVTNLVNYIGAVDTKYITFTRVFGLFFDLNQGMVLAYPCILVLYLLLYFLKIFRGTNWKNKLDLLILPGIILMVCAASSINNWNSGQAVVSRYVCYVGAAMLVHFFLLVTEISFLIIKSFILGFSIISQVYIVAYFDFYCFTDVGGNKPKPISTWVLRNHPAYYNPDPQIFIARYAPGLDKSAAESPALVLKNDTTITKLFIHKKHLQNLERFGISQKQIDSIGLCHSYVLDWAYIEPNENFKPSLTVKIRRKKKIEERIQSQIKAMKGIKEWYDLIKQKAAAQKITEDEMLRVDAIFVLKIEPELVKDFTKEERIHYIISKMRASAEWKAALIEKTKKTNLSLEQVMYDDANFMVEKDFK